MKDEQALINPACSHQATADGEVSTLAFSSSSENSDSYCYSVHAIVDVQNTL